MCRLFNTPSLATVHAGSREVLVRRDLEGKMNDLPGIDLKIDEAGGKVSGTVFSTTKNAATPMNRGM
jgi:hypothetical protein